MLLSKEFLTPYRRRSVPWGFGDLSYITYKRTYARHMEDGRKEEYVDTLSRAIEGAQNIGAGYTTAEAERLFDYMFNLKCLFAGRMMWQLGTKTVELLGGNSLINCWWTNIETIEDFLFLFDNLMLGGGVGFSVKREHVHSLPKVKSGVHVSHVRKPDADFIVPDSREGWVEVLRQMFQSYFETGKSFTYSTICLRPSGSPINGFGGTSAGPDPLVRGIELLSGILSAREGKRIRSLDALDICNALSEIVDKANVRRGAEIAIGDPDDFLYLRAKRWDLHSIPNWRARSNNSIFADSFEHISEEVWAGYEGGGEPYGFFNQPLARSYGRLQDKQKDNCEGMNPCGEITLANKECCDLGEVFLPRIESKKELYDVCRLLYKTQKAVTNLKFIHEATNEIVHKNNRIGVSMSGICQALDKLDWLDPVYLELKAFDKLWSEKRGWPTCIKLTTIKPSGTISLLAGVSPGIHPAYSKFHVRRIRIRTSDPLVKTCYDAGYNVEYALRLDGSEDHDVSIISFPCKIDNAIYGNDMGVIKQLELVKRVQNEWSDNSVSVTAYYTLEELPILKEWMKENYRKSLKSVSFLLHSGHGFVQAPLEEIDEQHYTTLKKKASKIQVQDGDMLDIECSSGNCPVR